MSSAEKKAPEPSMDDIISSIRNIIADDTQETAPAPEAPAVEAPAPAVVQLTENQIAEPGIAQVNGLSTSPDIPAPVPAPEQVVIAEPAIAPSTPDLDVASEIDAVPGLMAALEVPLVAAATQSKPVPVAPELTISEPLSPAAELEAAPINDVLAAPVPAVMPTTPDIMTAPAPEASIAPEPAAPAFNAPAAATIIEDDIAFVSPEDPQNSLADATLAPTIPSLTPTNDPVEEMMQSVNADKADGDLVNNGVDPDQILEGMEPAVAAITPSAPVEAAPVVQEQAIGAAPGLEAPVVLDASQVTPEDAVAITAVAAATTQALSGASPSEPVADTVQKSAGSSLEDSVKAMLKPMIREWLDDNMPRILEGAIKEEVDIPGSDKT